MIRTTLKIDGMMCGMCETHVCEAIRRAVPSAVKVSASRKKKEAVLLTENEIDTDAVRTAVDATGYSCFSVQSEQYEKRGIFRGK